MDVEIVFDDKEINEHTKRKVTFPSKNVIIIEGDTDIDHIFVTRNELFKYINNLDFDGLRSIQWRYIFYSSTF